jgi:ribosomal protein S18 acetylase RimI-like enzyme
VLASVSMVEHAELWRRRLLAPASPMSTFVATDAVGMVVGFGTCGPQQAALLRYDGEIYAVYILRRAQHQGLGRGLMAAMARRLQERGARSAIVWSARDNAPARQFYQGLGRHVGWRERPFLPRPSCRRRRLCLAGYRWAGSDRRHVAAPVPSWAFSLARVPSIDAPARLDGNHRYG